MIYDKVLEIVKTLEFDKDKVICETEGVQLFIHRPSKQNKRLKNQNYDVKKNFQIWLKDGDRKFKPNHLRVMIDLNLRARSRPDLKKKLSVIFDNIFYHKDPDEEIKKIEKEKFEHFLNPIKIIANLAQLLLIEQEYNYIKESKFDPPTLFLQGWIREFINNDQKEIDNMCMSVGRFLPPEPKYTYLENKKHKKYDSKHKEIWYINNS